MAHHPMDFVMSFLLTLGGRIIDETAAADFETDIHETPDGPVLCAGREPDVIVTATVVPAGLRVFASEWMSFEEYDDRDRRKPITYVWDRVYALPDVARAVAALTILCNALGAGDFTTVLEVDGRLYPFEHEIEGSCEENARDTGLAWLAANPGVQVSRVAVLVMDRWYRIRPPNRRVSRAHRLWRLVEEMARRNERAAAKDRWCLGEAMQFRRVALTMAFTECPREDRDEAIRACLHEPVEKVAQEC